DCTHYVGHGITGTEGMPVTVALRPEKIRLAREAPAESEFNHARGTVKDMAYFGSFTVYHLLLPSGAVLKVSTGNTERHRDHAIAVGDAAWASWAPTAQVVLTS
ncbi:MAG TPA: TOBE domain-containing protein, partial [Burkholderiaceae bacterium]|nr:TOBE domain-containing protein [Burkholderiaceae bacterium]